MEEAKYTKVRVLTHLSRLLFQEAAERNISRVTLINGLLAQGLLALRPETIKFPAVCGSAALVPAIKPKPKPQQDEWPE